MADRLSLSSTEFQKKPSRVLRQWNACSVRTKGITILTGIMLILFGITLPILLFRRFYNVLQVKKPQLVVLMLSGLRWDYIDLLPEPTLGGFRHFRDNGVRVEHVDTVFPSLKMSAWTTLQTGLYPEEHNVLGNRMFDQSSGLKFDWEVGSVSKLGIWWQYAEPVWITLSNQGYRVATLEWSSADVPYKNQLPEVHKGYTRSTEPFQSRINEVKERIQQNFDLVMMYYEGVDQISHQFGPASKEVMLEMHSVGKGVENLFSFLVEQGRESNTNILVVSDRGHAASCDVLPDDDITDFFKQNHYNENDVVIQDEAMYLIYTTPDREDVMLEQMQNIPGYEAHLLRDLPTEFHYKRGRYAPRLVSFAVPRDAINSSYVHPTPPPPPFPTPDPVPPFPYANAEANPGASVPIGISEWLKRSRREVDEEANVQKAPARNTTAPPDPNSGAPCRSRGGVCGLDPRRAPSMRTLLLGWGSAFAGGGLVHPPVHLVDVYQLFFHVLGAVPPERTGGRWSAVRGMLRGAADACSAAKMCRRNENISTANSTNNSNCSSTIVPNESSKGTKCDFDLEKYLQERKDFTSKWEADFKELRRARSSDVVV